MSNIKTPYEIWRECLENPWHVPDFTLDSAIEIATNTLEANKDRAEDVMVSVLCLYLSAVQSQLLQIKKERDRKYD